MKIPRCVRSEVHDDRAPAAPGMRGEHARSLQIRESRTRLLPRRFRLPPLQSDAFTVTCRARSPRRRYRRRRISRERPLTKNPARHRDCGQERGRCSRHAEKRTRLAPARCSTSGVNLRRRYDDKERPVTYLCFPRYGHEVTCRRHVPSALARWLRGSIA